MLAKLRTLNLKKFEPVVEFGQSILNLAILAGLAFDSFGALHWLLAKVGLPLKTYPLLGVWLAIGVVGALFWPVRYRRNVGGLWLENIPHFAFLALFGPWAFLLGFPL